MGLALAGPAYGAEPKTDEHAQEAMRHFDAGNDAADVGDWAKAREEYTAAWEAKPHYRIAWSLAEAEIALGKYRDASAHLEAALSEGKSMSGADRSEVTALLADTRAKLVKLRVKMDVAGADILVDGERVGTSPLGEDVVVDPGQRRIEGRKQGVKFAPVMVSLAPGGTGDVVLEVERRSPPHPAPDKDAEGVGWRPFVIAAGTTVALAGMGTGVGLLTLTPHDERGEATKWAVGAFAVGGVATVATLVVALSSMKSKPAAPKSGLWVAPMVGSRENGVWVGGAF